MASQISHIVYGRYIFEKLKLELNWKEFVIGTTFPDIRHLSGIEREKFHYFETALNKVPQDSSFEAGMYIHSYVDEKREEYLKSRGVYKLIGKDPIHAAALKPVEDEVVYGRLKSWDKIASFFDTILKYETELVDKKYVEKWHNFLKGYVGSKPDDKAWRRALRNISSYSHLTDEIMIAIEEIKNNKKVISIIRETKNMFK